MYRLFVWVQCMQGATTTPLNVNCTKSRTRSPQSIAKILEFLRLAFRTKVTVQRECIGCRGRSCVQTTQKVQLQYHLLQIINKVWQNDLIALHIFFIFHSLFKTNTRVHRQMGGCTGYSCGYNICKVLLQCHWLEIIQKVWQDNLIPIQK